MANYYIIQKPTIKDPKSGKYVGGNYQIFEESELEMRLHRLQNYKKILVSETDLAVLGKEGLFGMDNKDQIFYFTTVNPFRHYYLENSEKRDTIEPNL